MEEFFEDFVCYRKEPPVEDRRQAIAVLWPVYVWRVFAPNTSGKASNVFEKTLLSFLKMSQGSRLDAKRLEDISQWMGLESDMVQYILDSQLKPKGWVDSKTGEVTTDGDKAISGELVTSANYQTGYIFQDAIDGQLLPRYSTSFPTIEPQNDSLLEFSFSKATNWKWRPSKLKKSSKAITPSVSQLDGVMKLMRQAQRNAYLMGDDTTQRLIGNIEDVELADEKAELAYLWVWVYTDVQNVWAVADPFGLHPRVEWMRDKVLSALESSSHLSKSLSRLIGVEDDLDRTKLSELAAAREEQAKLEVLTEFKYADKVEGLATLLSGWVHRRLEVETTEYTDRFHDYRDLITQSSGLVELCTRYCLENYPLNNPSVIPRNCTKDDLKTLIIGVHPALTLKLLDEVVAVNPKTVYAAARNRQGSFRRCMAACLLALPDYEQHPITSVINDEILLLNVYRLSHWRDSAAHLDGSAVISKDMALKAYAIADAFLKKFLKGLSNG
ncbi:TPA: hypothetical protein ACMDVV_000989 [Vibrio parahaemolyticus]